MDVSEESRSVEHAVEALDALRERMGDCQRCALGATRTSLVFGVGDPAARLMFVGEAPGRTEDIKGEPFVGAAGKLLDELLTSIGLTRDDVYIANILKCRPPSNRDPLPAETAECTPFLDEQIRIIDPVVVATLGNHATHFILDTQRPIGEIHGRLFHHRGRCVVPIFHPAAALYDRSKGDVLFDDFKRLRVVLDRAADGQQPCAEDPRSHSREAHMDHVFTTRSTSETERAGALLAGCLEMGDIVALAGDLGAGKTHLVQGVGRGLGVRDVVTSPTFNILLVHPGRLPLYHFDLYRLEAEDQLEDIDFYATLEGDGVSFIEWGDRFTDALPADHLLVTIRRSDEESRVFTARSSGPRSAELMRCWADAMKGATGV